MLLSRREACEINFTLLLLLLFNPLIERIKNFENNSESKQTPAGELQPSRSPLQKFNSIELPVYVSLYRARVH